MGGIDSSHSWGLMACSKDDVTRICSRLAFEDFVPCLQDGKELKIPVREGARSELSADLKARLLGAPGQGSSSDRCALKHFTEDWQPLIESDLASLHAPRPQFWSHDGAQSLA